MAEPAPTYTSLPERLSVELTNFCSKGCPFCYNASTREGATLWHVEELEPFLRDRASHGVRAVSFGGGEPLEFEGVFDLLHQLKGIVFRSMTTNGLGLTAHIMERLAAAAPDKIHISIHYPHLRREVLRVRDQVLRLATLGIRSGVNLLVEKDRISDARQAAELLAEAGIGHERIVFLPLRSISDPALQTTPADIAQAAGGKAFQSMSCLAKCQHSPRFCAVSWDRQASWCSYTRARRPLKTLDAAGLRAALDGLGLIFCGAEPREEFAI